MTTDLCWSSTDIAVFHWVGQSLPLLLTSLIIGKKTESFYAHVTKSGGWGLQFSITLRNLMNWEI